MKIVLYLPFLGFLFLFSCLSPEEVVISTDPDILLVKSLVANQPVLLIGRQVKKEIKTQNGTSQKTFTIDSAFLKSDFEILEGHDLSRIFQSASYDKTGNGSEILFSRKKGESKGPASMKISRYNDGQIQSFQISQKESNWLYDSGETVFYTFDETGIITKYSFEGYQKLIGMDAFTHHIKGEIIPN